MAYPSKCKVMHLGRGNPTVYSMTDHTSGEGVELSLVVGEKDLDVWITSNLKLSLHCLRTAARATYTNVWTAKMIVQVSI